MKEKITISVEGSLLEKAQKEIVEGQFRNRSHILEYALKKLLREVENGS